ncbi:Cytochrome P450 [Mycena venus]|uniref:Cytochrome P450 n=1 Tax=Mycena venus TaxID=2733690 RepID=A0A8H6X3H3_9AGAR|nr:Cytochrome P450 [Mycena venus]
MVGGIPCSSALALDPYSRCRVLYVALHPSEEKTPSTTWSKWNSLQLGDVWGDIYSLTVFGKTLIVVNSVEVADDLLNACGANFSDRPVRPVGGTLAGFDNALPLVQYGDRMRKERKHFHQLFGTQAAIKQFIPLLSTEVHNLLRNIVSNPNGLADEIRRAAGSITLRIAYGYQPRKGPERDPFLEMFETAGNNFFLSSTSAAPLADMIPILRYWPEWMPGGGFHTTAKIWSKQLHNTVDTGMEYVKKEMAAGNAGPSFLSNVLGEENPDDYLKWAAIAIKVGGSDTNAAQLEAFFLAMTLYPDVQAAAQKEIAQVVGNDRLPDISDRPHLPYVDALCKEVIRWHVAVPLGIPHRTREDYIYNRVGNPEPLLIPKDSLILANIWKMTHDPKQYADPMAFNPSRFISTDGHEAEPDPGNISFGFGRRICPGKLLGETALFLECSAILSVFNISKARENGKVVEPELGMTSTSMSRVLPFKCVVEPRNSQALSLIDSS